MRSSALVVFAVAASFGAASAARGDDIVIFNSGVGADARVLPEGSSDPHYSIVAVPAGVGVTVPSPATVATAHPVYVQNDAVGSLGSSWIAISNDTASAYDPGVYAYRTTFDLSGLDAATAQLSGTFAVDDTVQDVLLNGASLSISGGQFIAFSSSFSITSGFVDGVNTLEFVTENLGGGGSPAGFRVVVHGTAAPSVVADTTAPVFASLSVSSTTVDSRSRRTTRIVVAAQVTDAGDPAPSVRIVAITPDDTDAGRCRRGDTPETTITGELTAEIRSDRFGFGPGASFTIAVEATDASGNVATATVQVVVRQDGSWHCDWRRGISFRRISRRDDGRRCGR